MRPEDLLAWLRGQPFIPFRIVMNSGTTLEIKHPEFVRVLRTSFLYFEPTIEENVYDWRHTFGLVLIERIEPLGSPLPAPASKGS